MENKLSNSSLNAQKIFHDVRAMFYLLTPAETYYEKAEEVPDLTKNVNYPTLFDRRINESIICFCI